MGKNYPGIFGRWWSSAFRLTTPIFVARGPALLFGISRWLSQHGISRKRRNNLTLRTDRDRAIDTEFKANSSHPSSREGHRCASLFGRWWSSAFRLTTPIFVARGPALLFGISRRLSQHGISRKRRNNLTLRTVRGRAIDTRVQSELVSSIVPRGTSLRWIVAPTVWRSSLRLSAPFPLSSGTRFHHSTCDA